jgi:hypothetical protein
MAEELSAPSPSPTGQSGEEKVQDSFLRGTRASQRSGSCILDTDVESSEDNEPPPPVSRFSGKRGNELDGSVHTSVRGPDSPLRVSVGRVPSSERGGRPSNAPGTSPLVRSPMRDSMRRIERVASSGSVSNLAAEFENEYGEWMLNEEDIDMTESSLIGEGSSGRIVRARYEGVDVAVKLLRGEEGEAGEGGTTEKRQNRRQRIKDLVQEVRASCALAGQMADMYHPNVVQLIGAALATDQVRKIVLSLVLPLLLSLPLPCSVSPLSLSSPSLQQ